MTTPSWHELTPMMKRPYAEITKLIADRELGTSFAVTFDGTADWSISETGYPDEPVFEGIAFWDEEPNTPAKRADYQGQNDKLAYIHEFETAENFHPDGRHVYFHLSEYFADREPFRFQTGIVQATEREDGGEITDDTNPEDMPVDVGWFLIVRMGLTNN